ncbi:hypothetical protein IPH70_02405 [Candidatus Roizmanbacteria bacterium]|nr:MAG: hypothetical protein IPH70_02405 [Candidatus Roizmanbacteria bacterium]
MVPLELPRSSFPEMRDRLNPKEAFLKICTPDFAGTNIMGITADFIMQNNIHAVFLDAEGTFIKTWGTLPHPQLAEHMRSLKERLDAEGYDFKTAIVTNRKWETSLPSLRRSTGYEISTLICSFLRFSLNGESRNHSWLS